MNRLVGMSLRNPKHIEVNANRQDMKSKKKNSLKEEDEKYAF